MIREIAPAGVSLVEALDSTIAETRRLIETEDAEYFDWVFQDADEDAYLAICMLDGLEAYRAPDGQGIIGVVPELGSSTWLALR